MDGGFSHPPAHIPRFIEAMEREADFAAGSRFSPGGSYSGRRSRYLISRGGTILANLLLGTRMRDMTSGFECFTRRALEEVVSRGVRSRGHFFQTEIRYMLRGWNWVEIPIRYRNPSRSVGRASLFEAFRILWALRLESGRERP
jgi:dolichol-phosphate mannosyltransferase